MDRRTGKSSLVAVAAIAVAVAAVAIAVAVAAVAIVVLNWVELINSHLAGPCMG